MVVGTAVSLDSKVMGRMVFGSDRGKHVVPIIDSAPPVVVTRDYSAPIYRGYEGNGHDGNVGSIDFHALPTAFIHTLLTRDNARVYQCRKRSTDGLREKISNPTNSWGYSAAAEYRLLQLQLQYHEIPHC